MPSITFDIDNKEVVHYTNRLRKMHKSDMPLAVRGTLNDLAFDVKKTTLPKEFKKQFTIRNKTFAKAHTGVEKATGWNVNTMQSQVGVYPKEEGGKSAKELTLQEHGGLKKKSFIYNKAVRGGSNKKQVTQSNYYNKYAKVEGQPSKNRTKRAAFIAAAIVAKRENKLLIWDSNTGKTLFKIDKVYLGFKNAAAVNATPIADYEENRSISLNKKPFVLPASKESLKKADKIFLANAKKRFDNKK